jgi:hypothetical protein
MTFMNKIFLTIFFVGTIVAPNVFAFNFPWQPKSYETHNQCMDVQPKTLQHKEFLDAICTRLFSGKPMSLENERFTLCARERVLKTSSVVDARKRIFECASSYPPKSKNTPLKVASDFFPTPEELSEKRAAEAQEREVARKQDARRQELMQPICTSIGGVLSCF